MTRPARRRGAAEARSHFSGDGAASAGIESHPVGVAETDDVPLVAVQILGGPEVGA